MKITPIEIRQHTFDKGMRGYKTEDVDAFLSSLSQEWERVTSDYKMLKMQLELAEKELGKLKEVEMTLFRTLKIAEDTSTQITEQANQAGAKYVDDAKQKADEMLAEARKRSVLMVQDAENQARFLKDNILNDLKSLEHDFKALEGYKENLAIQIRSLASNAVDSVDRFEKKFAKQNLKGKIDEVASQIQDELKQEEGNSDKEAAAQPTDQTGPAADLPELTERETAIPEAVPVSELPHEQSGESVQPVSQEAPQAVGNTETPVEQTAPESTLAEVNTSETESSAEAAPVKKGGSFFDQI